MIDEIQKQDKNEHIIKLWQPLEFIIDESYEYVVKGKIFSFCSNLLYYGIAFPILKVLTKLIYDLKIEGKENIRNLKTGAISVSNHVLILDCAMVGLSCGTKKIYYTTLEDSFKIPFVRKLIKLLRAIPIPKSIDNRGYFIKEIEKLLDKNIVVHFYPEASLFPYCTKIRNFKNGAFDLAVKNEIPIVPMVFIFREPKGIRKIFKRKKDVTLKVLEPITCTKSDLSKKEKVDWLREKVYNEMKSMEVEKNKI